MQSYIKIQHSSVNFSLFLFLQWAPNVRIWSLILCLLGAKCSNNNKQETCRNALCFRRLGNRWPGYSIVSLCNKGFALIL